MKLERKYPSLQLVQVSEVSLHVKQEE